MEALLELMKTGAGESLIKKVRSLHSRQCELVLTAARAQTVDQIRIASGRVEGVQMVVDMLEGLRK